VPGGHGESQLAESAFIPDGVGPAAEHLDDARLVGRIGFGFAPPPLPGGRRRHPDTVRKLVRRQPPLRHELL
jgi:hypothetical protein